MSAEEYIKQPDQRRAATEDVQSAIVPLPVLR